MVRIEPSAATEDPALGEARSGVYAAATILRFSVGDDAFELEYEGEEGTVRYQKLLGSFALLPPPPSAAPPSPVPARPNLLPPAVGGWEFKVTDSSDPRRRKIEPPGGASVSGRRLSWRCTERTTASRRSPKRAATESEASNSQR